jgi:hypothetical protein
MIHSKTEMVSKKIPNVHTNSKNIHKKKKGAVEDQAKRRRKICGGKK